MNYVYLLRCADGSLYCGWTTDLEARLKAHNNGTGAKYTRSRRPVELVYFEEYADKHEALSREWHIKQLNRSEKEALISTIKTVPWPLTASVPSSNGSLPTRE
ncbi:MAG: GIY-YIG nuclease family protein [Blautia sp.]|nr:GIY-YIG nuclease family protein [Blautia sp.]